MSKAKNKVIAGDYSGFHIMSSFGIVSIVTGFGKSIALNNTTVDTYEVITDEHRKSAVSGDVRGLVGGFLLGGVGILAGGLSAKEKGVFQVAIKFKDEKKSLIEMDDKIYKSLIKSCFR